MKDNAIGQAGTGQDRGDETTHATTRHIQIKETQQVKTRGETRQGEVKLNKLREDETNGEKSK